MEGGLLFKSTGFYQMHSPPTFDLTPTSYSFCCVVCVNLAKILAELVYYYKKPNNKDDTLQLLKNGA